METQSLSQTDRLIRRNGTWHYRRRVPRHLVETFGRKEVHRSLGTSDLKEAKKLRAVEDIRWDREFEAAAHADVAQPATPDTGAPIIPQHEKLRLVQEFVARMDESAQAEALENPPADEAERDFMREDVGTGLAILQNRDDSRAAEWVHGTILRLTANGAAPADVQFGEMVRRGLLELQRRRLNRLDDLFAGSAIDPLFLQSQAAETNFGALAQQYLRLVQEEAAVNGTNQKWVDKQKANIALLTEILGQHTLLRQIDYDACMRVRSVLGRLPANRAKRYADLSIDDSLAAAGADGTPGLSAATQKVYLATFQGIMALGQRKGLISANPAQGLKPLKKELLTGSAKRLPFAPDQLKGFFEGKYYRKCAQQQPAWQSDKKGWRFWLPLLCLFMGMRPNEVCQMATQDVRQTQNGTWYLDVVVSDDEDDDASPELQKTLKTAFSRRRIPLHPEVLAIGFLDFVATRKEASRPRLFPDLEPDKYGNFAKYAMRRFRETFLPSEIDLKPRQSFYSFRHNFRDALRAVNAPPDALQALGGWSQGKLTSDDYGDKTNPDYQARFVKQIEYPGLLLTHLHAEHS